MAVSLAVVVVFLTFFLCIQILEGSADFLLQYIPFYLLIKVYLLAICARDCVWANWSKQLFF